MGGVVFFLVVCAVVGIAAYAAWRVDQRRKTQSAAYAASLGLQYAHGPQPPPPIPFQQFSIGRSRQARYLFWKEGDPLEACAFSYQYTTGSGKNSTTHRFACVTFRTPMWAPHLVLDRQGFFRDMLNSLGLRDIQVEWPVFNDTWHVSCQDERFAITFLDPAMMNWLMQVGGGGSIEIELIGDRGVAITNVMPVQQLVTLLDYARQFVEQVPRVVPDLYPRPQ